MRIIWRHVFPQCGAVLIVLLTMNIGGIIITEASLSYPGAGDCPSNSNMGQNAG